MNVQIIRQTDKKTHTDSPMIGIMTERESIGPRASESKKDSLR